MASAVNGIHDAADTLVAAAEGEPAGLGLTGAGAPGSAVAATPSAASSALGRLTAPLNAASPGGPSPASRAAASPSLKNFDDALADLDEMMSELGNVNVETTPVPPRRANSQGGSGKPVALPSSPSLDAVPASAAPAVSSPGAPSPAKPFSFSPGLPATPEISKTPEVTKTPEPLEQLASPVTLPAPSVAGPGSPPAGPVLAAPSTAAPPPVFAPRAPSPLPMPSVAPIEVAVPQQTGTPAPMSPISLASSMSVLPVGAAVQQPASVLPTTTPSPIPESLPAIPPISFSPLPEWGVGAQTPSPTAGDAALSAAATAPATFVPDAAAPATVQPPALSIAAATLTGPPPMPTQTVPAYAAPLQPPVDVPDRRSSAHLTNASRPSTEQPMLAPIPQQGQLGAPGALATGIQPSPSPYSELSYDPAAVAAAAAAATGVATRPPQDAGSAASVQGAPTTSLNRKGTMGRFASTMRPLPYVPTNLPPPKKERRGCCGLLPFRMSDVLPGYREHVWARFLYFILLCMLLVAVLAVPTALVYVGSQTERNRGGQIYPGTPGVEGPAVREGLLMGASIITLDDLIDSNSMLIRFNFYPTGRYAARIGTQPNNQSFPPPMALTISCEFGPGVPFSPGNAAQYEFLAGAPPPLVTVPAPIYGPNDMFPFDTHNIELGIRCWQGSAVEGTVTEVPIYVELIGVVQSWRFALTTLHNPTYTRWTADIYASRSPTTVFFAIFIMILMWCLAMSMAYMFYYYSFRAPRGRMPADLLSVGPTIVFALPFVREAVPGTPPAGVLSDYIAYFWCEAIVVITTVGLIAVWFLRHQAPFHANWRWRSSAPADMEMVYKGQSAVLSLDNLEREPIGSNEDAEGHALHEDAEGHALPPDAEAHNLHED